MKVRSRPTCVDCGTALQYGRDHGGGYVVNPCIDRKHAGICFPSIFESIAKWGTLDTYFEYLLAQARNNDRMRGVIAA